MTDDNAMLDYLINLYVDSVTAAFSDDPSAVRKDRARFEDALNNQDIYTKYDVQLEASNRHDFIAKPQGGNLCGITHISKPLPMA